jgi:pSer/pThr/pTyr-binding forkhead associated (FHA) protein
MQNRVWLEIVDGPLKGKKFEFTEHDTFIFGRARDCHADLPNNTLVSRSHFLLEVNPPLARLCDLGSLNAPHVNNRRFSGLASQLRIDLLKASVYIETGVINNVVACYRMLPE